MQGARGDAIGKGARVPESATIVNHVPTAFDERLLATGQVLQSLVWPDPQVHPDPALSLRLGPGATVQENPKAVLFEPGGVMGLDTAYNIFSMVKWNKECGITDLSVILRGAGRFTLEIVAERPQQREVLRQELTLSADQPALVDLTHWLAGRIGSVLHLSLTAVTSGQIVAVDWFTRLPPRRRPKLLLCVTTFRREDAATATALRINAELQNAALADGTHLLIVDNGQSLTLPPLAHVTLVPNRNLGGAGGFARGLSEAIARGYSHCLFMDDDAWVDFASIKRSIAFLANVTNPDVAIAAALTRADTQSVVWENGATFDGVCRSRARNANLTRLVDLIDMEFESSEPQPLNLYGGFWFFAFAISSVRHWTFPFFVRGDDISFSIVNDFAIVTLPGVMSFQAQDFPDKETSLTIYLDMRCDMVQNLTLPQMPNRFFRLLRTPIFFFGRSLIQCHYDSLRALNLSIEDVLRGPDFFAANVDLAQRRSEIAALRQREVWTALDGPLPKVKKWIDPQSLWQRTLMKLTVNGLLLPFFARWGNHMVIPQNERQSVRPCWGAAHITYVSKDGRRVMHVHHEKMVALREGLRMVWNIARTIGRYRALRAAWTQGYPKYTTKTFWQARFDEDAQPAVTASTARHSPQSPAR